MHKAEISEFTQMSNQALAQLNWQPALSTILARTQELLAQDGIPSVLAASSIWSLPFHDEDVFMSLYLAMKDVLGTAVNPIAVSPLFKLVYESSDANPVIEQMLIQLIS